MDLDSCKQYEPVFGFWLSPARLARAELYQQTGEEYLNPEGYVDVGMAQIGTMTLTEYGFEEETQWEDLM